MGNFGHWAIVLAVVAALYGLLGYGGMAGDTAPAAVIVFWITIVIASTLIVGRIIQRS